MPHARWFAPLTLTALLGCGNVKSVTPDGSSSATCDPLGAFDPPQVLTGIDASGSPADPAPSADELTLYLTQAGPASDRDLYMTSRRRITDAFGPLVRLTAASSASEDGVPTLSSDGLTLIFQSHPISTEGEHLYVATRPSKIADFGARAPVAGVGSPMVADDDLEPFLTADGQELWFISTRAGNRDIFRAARVGAGFANPATVPELNSPSPEQHVTLSADRLTVYFASTRPTPGVAGGYDIYRAHRSTVADGFGTPVPVPEVNTASDDYPRWLSADNCRLYLHARVGGSFQIFVASRRPAP